MKLTLRERYSNLNNPHQNKFDGIKPLVSIVATCYNHGKYVRDAIEGFLMQITDFHVEIIIHDDCSTDNSADIIREYEREYPALFHAIYQQENQYSKGVNIWNDIVFPLTHGKYIALCETDDYWTDPNKLQKQVDFLESHPDVSLCFHNARTLMIDGSFKDNLYNLSGSREYSPNEILKRWTIPTGSVIFKNGDIATDPIKNDPKFKYGDNVLFLTAAKHGKLYGIDEFMAVYRKQEGSLTTAAGPIRWAEINIEHLKAVNRIFSFMLEKNLCKNIIANQYIYLIRRHRNRPIGMLKYFYHALKDIPYTFLANSFNTWILRKK